jgi:hypothetical protein
MISSHSQYLLAKRSEDSLAAEHLHRVNAATAEAVRLLALIPARLARSQIKPDTGLEGDVERGNEPH